MPPLSRLRSESCCPLAILLELFENVFGLGADGGVGSGCSALQVGDGVYSVTRSQQRCRKAQMRARGIRSKPESFAVVGGGVLRSLRGHQQVSEQEMCVGEVRVGAERFL